MANKHNEKRLNIINHYGNAGQNHNKMPLHTQQDGYNQRKKEDNNHSWQGRGETVTLTHCWWEYGTPTLEQFDSFFKNQTYKKKNQTYNNQQMYFQAFIPEK